MTFRSYMRLDGWVALLAGASLFLFGLSQGHQGPADAGVGGLVMVAGTGLFMTVRHRASFRDPASWFTSRPLARVLETGPACTCRRLLLAIAAETILLAATAIGLSYLSGFWLTYMDMGVWAMAIGAIKAGPASTAIERQEVRSGDTYRVVHRPLRGVVQVSASACSEADNLRLA